MQATLLERTNKIYPRAAFILCLLIILFGCEKVPPPTTSIAGYSKRSADAGMALALMQMSICHSTKGFQGGVLGQYDKIDFRDWIDDPKTYDPSVTTVLWSYKFQVTTVTQNGYVLELEGLPKDDSDVFYFCNVSRSYTSGVKEVELIMKPK